MISREKYLRQVSQILTEDEYNRLSDGVMSFSDEEWESFCVWAKSAVSNRPDTPNGLKEFRDAQREYMEMRGLTHKDMAANKLPSAQISNGLNSLIVGKIRESSPTDYIKLTDKEDNFLIDLWEAEGIKEVTIPSDIFFAGTIPLLDCVIAIDERGIGGVVCETRVIVFDDYKKRIADAKDDTPVVVGAVMPMGEIANSFFIPIVVVRGLDMATHCGIGYFEQNSWKVDALRRANALTGEAVTGMFVQWLETWYGIQIALLHPHVQEVFRNPAIECVSRKSTSKNQKRRKVRYIKKHVLNLEEMSAVATQGKKINRKCLVWYVIGHWRVYKSGKKIFVRPYWKGELRSVKIAIEAREREIVV